ncbi:hypothetical protein DFH07DRAFT_19722 [Mycena maculata]|uniref:Uncharacterized protein n=1 Tax=Mycena maculata TaxID=230809 RepID=A0AAD7IK75_9AGAR|nr:hypothetical protein DFH07DRAFT_19722 [Mycena maculata]
MTRAHLGVLMYGALTMLSDFLHLSQLTKALSVVDECILLVLRRILFLPEHQPMLINTTAELRSLKPDDPQLSSWIPYHAQANSPTSRMDGLSLNINSSPSDAWRTRCQYSRYW